MSGEQRSFAFEQLVQGVDARVFKSRNLIARISDVRVERIEVVHVFAFIGFEIIDFVERNGYGHTVCFGRGNETVDKRSACFRSCHGDDEQGEVDVGGENMALLREVRSFADDVVSSFVDFGDESRLLSVDFGDGHAIAYSDGVG